MADGHEIIERNWRTRYCEIDIVSKKDNALYFTEVKYRKNDNFGDGLAAITNKNSNKCVLLLKYSLPKMRSMKAVICKCWQFLLMEIRP